MGSFNYTCSLTDLGISRGKEVALFLITKREHVYNRTNLLDGVHKLYDVVGLPVYGKYNEYGSIDKIQQSSIVENYEVYFGLPMKDIIKIVQEQYKTYYTVGTLTEKYGLFKKVQEDLNEELFIEFLTTINEFKNYTKSEADNCVQYTTIIKDRMGGKDRERSMCIEFADGKTYFHIPNKTDIERKEVEDILELSRLIHQYYNLMYFYPEKIRKFIDKLESMHIIMMHKDAYEKMSELGTVDVDVFEDDIDKEVNIFKENTISRINERKVLDQKEQDLKKALSTLAVDSEEYEKVNEDLKACQFELIGTNIYGMVDAFSNPDYAAVTRRFEYSRIFKRLSAPIYLDNAFLNELAKLLKAEQAMESMGKYYRLPGYSAQMGTKREKLFIQFLAEKVVKPKRPRKNVEQN